MKKRISILTFWIVVTILYVICISVPESGTATLQSAGTLVRGLYAIATAAVAAAAVIGLLSVSRRLFAVLFPVLVLISALSAYFTSTIGVGLTPMTLELAMINDATMWGTMISGEVVAVAVIALTTGIAAAVVRWKFVSATRARQLLMFDFSFLLAAVTGLLKPLNADAAPGNKMPCAIFSSVYNYLESRAQVAEDRDTYSQVTTVLPENPPEVIVVLGETLRTDHLPQNGYHRNTMPRVAADPMWISIPEVYTPFTFTDHSLPRILTSADDRNPDGAFNQESFITLLGRAGYATSWLANQELTRSYSFFAYEADTLINVNLARTYNQTGLWTDNEILPHLRRWLTTSKEPHLAVLHTIGSHWIYDTHYTPAQAAFKPEATSPSIAEQSREQMINSYDNTVIATDDFLWRLASMFANRNAVIIFISDHGESLGGEDGGYMHGADNEACHYPACLVWFSPEYARLHPERVSAVRANRLEKFTTDNIFHTVVDASAVTTDAPDYEPARSMFHR